MNSTVVQRSSTQHTSIHKYLFTLTDINEK